MRKKWKLCVVVTLLTVVCFSMSACVKSDEKKPVGNSQQTEIEEEKKIPTLEEVLKEQAGNEETIDSGEQSEENLYEEDHTEDTYQEEYYEEAP